MEIVHRDVSPGNILVSARGEVKLSDFGIAKAEGRMSRTEVGMIKGNVSFMSPEQARGEPVDLRSDLFSAAVVLYYCLTAQFLYQDETMFNRLVRAAIGPAIDRVQPARRRCRRSPPTCSGRRWRSKPASVTRARASSPAISPVTSPPAAPSSPT